MNDKIFATMKDLKIGKYVLIDDVPCRVVEIQTSSPGKHGAAKMRISAMGLFDGQKKTLLKPSDGDVEVPIVERKNGQIMSLNGSIAQIMDSTTYETFEIQVPADITGAESGKEVEYLETMGKRLVMRIK
ncbi:MAG: translation initiation factor IF-5A [Candidatus Micrarchaeota archaeon]